MYHARGGHIVIVKDASRAMVGKIFVTGQEVSIDVHWWALRHNELIGLPYLFFLLSSNMQKWVRLADSSSTQKGNLKISHLLPLKFKLPPQFLIDKFNSFCEPIFELQKSNEQIIKKLLRLQKGWVESLD